MADKNETEHATISEGGFDFEESGNGEEECEKRERHKEYIPVSRTDFMDQLPPECQNAILSKCMNIMSALTVRVVVNKTSSKRVNGYTYDGICYKPKAGVRTGTGYIRLAAVVGERETKSQNKKQVGPVVIKGQPCPCRVCKRTEKKKMIFLKTYISTAAHVVFDSEEADGAVFECYFDSPNRTGVKKLYGLWCDDGLEENDKEVNGSGGTEKETNKGNCNKESKKEEERRRELQLHLATLFDMKLIVCVTHDEDLIKELRVLYHKQNIFSGIHVPSTCALIISHPHGWPKQIAYGRITHCHIPFKLGVISPLKIVSAVKFRLNPLKKAVVNQDTVNKKGKRFMENIRNKVTITQNIVNWVSQIFNILKLNKELIPSPTHSQSSSVDIEKGKEYSLPFGFTFTLPAPSVLNCQFPYRGENEDDVWIDFPEKTRFSLQNGKDIFFPGKDGVHNLYSKVQFNWKELKYLKKQYSHHKIYNIPSCGGSSGAPVLHKDEGNPLMSFLTHQGSLTDGNSRSGMYTAEPKGNRKEDKGKKKKKKVNVKEFLSIMGMTIKFDCTFPELPKKTE